MIHLLLTFVKYAISHQISTNQTGLCAVCTKLSNLQNFDPLMNIYLSHHSLEAYCSASAKGVDLPYLSDAHICLASDVGQAILREAFDLHVARGLDTRAYDFRRLPALSPLNFAKSTLGTASKQRAGNRPRYLLTTAGDT